MNQEETNEVYFYIISLISQFTKITQSLHKRIKHDLASKQKEAIPYLPEMIDKSSFSKVSYYLYD